MKMMIWIMYCLWMSLVCHNISFTLLTGFTCFVMVTLWHMPHGIFLHTAPKSSNNYSLLYRASTSSATSCAATTLWSSSQTSAPHQAHSLQLLLIEGYSLSPAWHAT